MYSDTFCLERTKPQLTLYNLKLLNQVKDTLNIKQKRKIIKNCNKYIELLTYDILALLNVYKHFEQNETAIKYLKQQRTKF